METQCISPVCSYKTEAFNLPKRPLSIEVEKKQSFEEFCLTLSPLLSARNLSKYLLESPLCRDDAVAKFCLVKTKKITALDANSSGEVPSVSVILSDSEPELPLKRPKKTFVFGGESFKPKTHSKKTL